MTRPPGCTCRYQYTVRHAISTDGTPIRNFITDAVRAQPDDACSTHGNPGPLLTEAAGPVRCRDCGSGIERGEPCVDMSDQTGDVLCETCGDERKLL